MTDARALFGGIASRYDAPAEVLSFGQYARWRRTLVEALPIRASDVVLDVACGTGLIADRIRARHGARVVGADQSEEMLAGARARALTVTAADATRLPFPDATFDHVVFSYLLRYVDDPKVALVELARVLKPGGTIANVEFGMPSGGLTRWGWRLYALNVLPVAASAFGGGWRQVGAFLGGSIVAWCDTWPLERQVDAWASAGFDDIRVRRMTWGTGVLMVGVKR